METTIQSDPISSVGIPVREQDQPMPHPTSAQAEQRDLFTRAHRRKLPDERKAITHKFSVGGHKGYLIVGLYEEGTPGEIFIKMSKEGSTLSGFMDGLALSISVGLQYGVPLKTLVDKLMNTRFEPSGFTENPSIRYASSVLDYIARWLGGRFLSPEYPKPRISVGEQEPNQPAGAVISSNAKDSAPADRGNRLASVGHAPSCTACGMLMVPNGSCYKCVNCGSTSGCSGAERETRGDLDRRRWQGLRREGSPSRDPPRRPVRHDGFCYGMCLCDGPNGGPSYSPPHKAKREQ